MALTRALRRVLHLGALATFVGLSGSEPVLDGALQAPASAKLVVTPLMGQCYSNGTTTFRANAPVKWQLFALDGSGVPYSVLEQTPTQLTVEAGHRGGRLLVLASATTCEAGSPCAEQLGSPTCAGVLSGETTLAQVGAGLCSQAFANASWSIVPWWKVVGITVMLTSLGVLFALVVVARLKVVKLDSVASQEIGGVSYALPAEVSSRLAMAFGSQSAPLFPAAASSLKQEPSIYA